MQDHTSWFARHYALYCIITTCVIASASLFQRYTFSLAGDLIQQMGKYDVLKSPYVELETPFTTWCVRCVTAFAVRFPPALRPLAVAVHSSDSHKLVCSMVCCREAFKMLLLLPTVPIRLAVIVAAIIAVAIVNSLAILGW